MESVAKDRAVESALAGAPSHATPSAELTLKVGKRFAVAEEFSLDVAFSAEAGFTILFGASGAGKTTLLDCIAGLVRPDAGVIRLGKRVFFDDAAKIDVKVSRRNVSHPSMIMPLSSCQTIKPTVRKGRYVLGSWFNSWA